MTEESDAVANDDSAVGENTFHIVGMGGSAGALEAFSQFFSNMPADSGMAFVVVPHLEPTHKAMMAELLSHHTRMEVSEAKDGMEIRPNHVYVIPPNADLAISNGRLQVLPPTSFRGMRMPIDFFFRHLAEAQKDKAIAVLFSGMGSDGTLGIKAIKEQLGVVMVQEPASANYDAMPRSAIHTGMVDYIGRAEELPARIIQFGRYCALPLPDHRNDAESAPSAMQKIFLLLRARTGNDFSTYKHNMVRRRIERRLFVHQFENLDQYARLLQENPQEVQILFRELLIGVTNFFRDPGLFDFLRDKAFHELLQNRPADQPVRLWNPGCSTGEETYSLSIVLQESLGQLGGVGLTPEIQIFATDIDNQAIDRARTGIFSPSIAADVSPERLSRYFLCEENTYRIKREVRDRIIFATQNLLSDPPFTKLDIICCRNFLIYVNPETQKKLIPLLHYALNPGGLLILGTAESIGAFEHLFEAVDRQWKVFKRKEPARRTFVELPLRPVSAQPSPVAANIKTQTQEPVMDVFYSTQRMLLDLYGPPAVVSNADGDIVYFNGRTGGYLEPASGRSDNNLFAMAREGLREELHLAIHKAASEKAPVIRENIRVKSNGSFKLVRLKVTPMAEPGDLRGMFLVVFEEAQASDEGREKGAPSGGETMPSRPESEVEDELRHTRERLQLTIEEMEATQEELRSTNEELQSNNEELQSSNEELTSSKEELQSLNEEMQTVNAELQAKMGELSQSNSDMKNLLNGIDIATIFLNNDLNIKRFTSSASRIVNLVQADVGRPLSHFATNLKHDRLVQDAKDVLESLVPREVEIQATDGRWYNMRVLPYRTLENVIDGVVVTFADITALKHLNDDLKRARAAADEASGLAAALGKLEKTEDTLRESEQRYRALVTASSDFLYRMSPDWSEMRQLTSRGLLADTTQPSSTWLKQYIPPDEQPIVTSAIRDAVSTKSAFELEHQIVLADGNVGWVSSRAVPILDSSGRIIEWFGAANDVTARKRAEEAQRKSAEDLRESQLQTTRDLAAMKRLHALAVQYASERELGSLLSEVVQAAIELSAADMGTIQLIDSSDGPSDRPSDGTLRFGAQNGFAEPFLEGTVGDTVEALRRGERILIEDVEKSPKLAGTPMLDVLRSAGVRAIQSTPLLGRGSRLVGVLSTHWRKAHQPDEWTLRHIDLLARQAADFIEGIHSGQTAAAVPSEADKTSSAER